MALFIYKLGSTNPFFNLAIEEYFLIKHSKSISDIYLFFYENSTSIVLGKTLHLDEEIYMHKKRPNTIRRSSGGGSVVHFPGSLNFGLLLSLEQYPKFMNIAESYISLLQPLSNYIYPKVKIKIAGISDLSMEQRGILKKISGNAQVRKKKWLLHHGTILYENTHFSYISYFLKPPLKQPDYRKARNHKDFILKKLPYISKNQLIRQIIFAFSKKFNLIPTQKNISISQNPELRNFINNYIQEKKL